MTLQEELEAEAKNILLLPHSWIKDTLTFWNTHQEVDQNTWKFWNMHQDVDKTP